MQPASDQPLDEQTEDSESAASDSAASDTADDSVEIVVGAGSDSVIQGFSGFAAIAMIWVVLGAAMHGLMRLTELIFNGNPPPWLIAIYIQTILVPPLIAAGFAMAVPVLVDRTVIFRCLLSMLVFAPGVASFLLSLFQNNSAASIDLEAFIVLSAATVSACVVGIVIQLVSGRSLHHKSEQKETSKPLGIRTLMELTLVVSLQMAMTAAMKDESYWGGVIIAGILGGLAALLSAGACNAFLRPQIRKRSYLFTIALTWICSGFFIVASFSEGFSQPMTSTDWYRFSLLPLAGVVSSCTMIALCFWVLRKTGWRFGRR